MPIGSGDRLLRTQPGPGYGPGGGRDSGAVTRSDVDAVPGHAGQGGGSVMGHDGSYSGVDPSRTLMPALTVDTRLFVSFAIVYSGSCCNGDRP
jgi:hypothetical protein